MKKIKTQPVKYPSKFLQPDFANAKDFIDQLAIKDPLKRLGAKGGADEIKQHPLFLNCIPVDWNMVRYMPPETDSHGQRSEACEFG